MNTRRKKLSKLFLVLLIFIFAVFCIKNLSFIKEQYWIWKVKNCERHHCVEPIEELANLKSFKGVHAVVKRIDGLFDETNWWSVRLDKRTFVVGIRPKDFSGSFGEFKNYFLSPDDEIKVFGIEYLHSLKIEDETRLIKLLTPYLSSKSIPLRAVIASIIYENNDKLNSYIPKNHISPRFRSPEVLRT